MSLLTTTAAIAATAILATAALTQFKGPSISTDIEIAAPVHIVWEELTNGAAYPEWNPFVRQLSGELQAGNRLNVTIQQEGGNPMQFTPEVLVAEANRELRWVGRLGFQGIFDGEHRFILEEIDDQTTRLHHGETFTGLLGYPLLALIRQDTLNGFEAMNEALRERAEGRV